nr:uncharacterized protein LOC124810996 [Hydra vulgaris]
MKETCKSVLENINTSWNSLYDTPFLKVLSKLPSTNLVEKLSSADKKKKLRKSHRKLKATIENHWEKYSKDTNTLFGVRQSRSSYLKIRSSLHFESKKDAVKRTTCFTSNAIGQKRKRHSPNPNNIDFNKVEMLNEVQKMKKGSEINLSALAKKYKIDGLNGNMVVREFLEQNNVDITAFSSTKLNKTRVRRKLNKLSGSGISVPIPRSFKKIKEDLNQNITSGKYILGTLIEPKIYSSISTDKHGKIEISKSSISGRKISLHELRKKIFENHISQKIIRENPTGIYSRNLIIWSDHASILNSGHLLLIVKPIYDDELYYNDKEMFDKTGNHYNVQELVETPHLYIFGCINDTIAGKLSYVESRLEDIKDLHIPIKINGQEIHDVLRFFHGINSKM